MSGTKTAFEIIDSTCLAPKTPYRSDETHAQRGGANSGYLTALPWRGGATPYSQRALNIGDGFSGTIPMDRDTQDS
jgi:hypothetical protein